MKTFGFLSTVVLALVGCTPKSSQFDHFKCDMTSGADCPDAGDQSDGGAERTLSVNVGIYGPSKAPGRKTWVVLGAGRAVHEVPVSGTLTVLAKELEDVSVVVRESDGRAKVVTAVGLAGDSFNFPSPPPDVSTTKTISATASVAGRGNEATVWVGSTYSGGTRSLPPGTSTTLMGNVPTDVQTMDVFAEGRDDGGTPVSYALAQNVSNGQSVTLELLPLDESEFVSVTSLTDYPRVEAYEELCTGNAYDFNRIVYRSPQVEINKTGFSSVIRRPSTPGLTRIVHAYATGCSIDGVACAWSQRIVAPSQQGGIRMELLSAFQLMTPSLEPQATPRQQISDAHIQWKTPTAGQFISIELDLTPANAEKFKWVFLVDPSVGSVRPFAMPNPLPSMEPGVYRLRFQANWNDAFQSFDQLFDGTLSGFTGAEERNVGTEGKVEFY